MAGDVFSTAGAAQSDLGAFHNLQKESIYRSTIREPLGSGYIRGHHLPPVTQDPNFRFGISTSSSEDAKNIIYLPTKAPHLRSHGATDTSTLNESQEEYGTATRNITTSRAANQQAAATMSRTATLTGGEAHHQERLITRPINREYNWASSGIDPAAHRFGKISNANPASNFETGVASVLKHAALEDARTNIGSKRVEEAKSNSYDHLGKGRRQRGAVLAGDPRDPHSMASGENLNYTGHRSQVYGRPGKHDEWGARDCIRGVYSDREQMPDADLGRSSFKVTALEYVPQNHTARSFGLPSIRADRPPPKMKSVANDMNYGDESNGKGVLYPSPFATSGVNEEDFLREQSPQAVRKVFETLGLQIPEVQFSRVVALARARYGALSVDSFRHCWNQVREGIICEECGEIQCQHEECAVNPCGHDDHANHSKHARHVKQSVQRPIHAAGFTSNTHPHS